MTNKLKLKKSKPLSKDKVSELIFAESNAIKRETIAALLLLRWIGFSESKREAIAIMKGEAFSSVLPSSIRWGALCNIHTTEADQLAERLRELSEYLFIRSDTEDRTSSLWLRKLAPLFDRLSRVNSTYLLHELGRVNELPFDTASDRLNALDSFDVDLDDRIDSYYEQHRTPVNIANLVVALAAPKAGESIYDPCFGSANLLIEANRYVQSKENLFANEHCPLVVAGNEVNQISFLVGLVRMLLAGIETPLVLLGNSLSTELTNSPQHNGYDLVISNPPIGMRLERNSINYQSFDFPSSDTTGLFVQHALSQLRPSGRAVIAVPESFLYRGGPERDLRRYLVEKGYLEAVIGLPSGAISRRSSVKCSLLVINKSKVHKHVRLADASALFERKLGNSDLHLKSELIGQLVSELNRADLISPGSANKGTFSQGNFFWEMKTDEIISLEWDLTPRRREKGALDEILIGVKQSMGNNVDVVKLSEVVQVIPGRVVKFSDLLDQPPNEFAMGYVRIRDLAHGKVGRISNWVPPALVNAERKWSLLPGDLVISKSGTIGKVALVQNSAVGGLAASGLFTLRVNHNRVDPEFLLAYLSTPASQAWLASRSRGSAIQHLNRAAIEDLPIPLPSLKIQVHAATQLRDFSGDILKLLSEVSGSKEIDRLAIWFSDLESLVPKFSSSSDKTPPLRIFESIGLLVEKSKNWQSIETFDRKLLQWLHMLGQAVTPMMNVAQVPPGPALLNILREGERGFRDLLNVSDGILQSGFQYHEIADRLLNWIRSAILDLFEAGGLCVRTAPQSLVAGSIAEFSVELENDGFLPLRNVRIESQPDWGSTVIPYFAERSTQKINLRGDIPKLGGNLTISLSYSAENLAGSYFGSVIQIAFRVVEDNTLEGSDQALLGGSPYVIGSPLEPQSGHSVFFGREELLVKISRLIENHGNVVLLEGNRRAGKTSILKHLEGHVAIPGWLAVYASLQGAEGSDQVEGVPTTVVFRMLALAIAKGVSTLGCATPLPDGTEINQVALNGLSKLDKLKEMKRCREACNNGISTNDAYADFRDYLEILISVAQSKKLGIVLMLDEFDKLQDGIDNGITSPQVPENIRFLIQSNPKFSAILTGSRRLKRLREQYWSALYGLGTSIQVTALNQESARQVVTVPVRNQLAYSAEAVDRVIKITARHPFLIQCLCNSIYEFAVQTNARSITVDTVNAAANELVRDNEHFASLWDFAAKGPSGGFCRQLILLLCAKNFKLGTHLRFGTVYEQLSQLGIEVSEEQLDVDLIYLRELELVDFSGEIGEGYYYLAIPLMADWIEQQQDADVISSRARAESEDKDA